MLSVRRQTECAANIGPQDDRATWFINLRWLACLFAAGAVLVSKYWLNLLPDSVVVPLWAGIGTLFATNLLYLRLNRSCRDMRSFVLWQMAADLLILTWLLHFSGGLENPLFILYTFHVILAGILLPRRDAFSITTGTALLFLGMVLAEFFHIMEHYTLTVFPHHELGGGVEHASHQWPFVFGFSSAFVLLLFGIFWFTMIVMDRLRESQEKLIRAERLSTLGRLVAYIAHEVNNPIGIISTRMKLARSGSTQHPSFLKETLEIVDRQADRVSQVVKSLLSFSKLDSKPKSLVDLNQAFGEALFIAEGRISRAGIILERHFYQSLPPIKGNYYDLVHVFLNLINNALDAMPSGGNLSVETRMSNGWLESRVSDTGKGIPKENLPRVFDPFFTTKSHDQGTGLGLSISLSLVKSLGGEIKVENINGKGSSFLVRIPIQPHVTSV